MEANQYIKEATYLAHHFADLEQEYQFRIRELEARLSRLERRQGRKPPARFHRQKVKAATPIEEIGQKMADTYGLYSLQDGSFNLVGKVSIMTFTKAKFERSKLNAVSNL
jgi:hypothetical protein